MIALNPDGAITSLLNGATNSVTLALNLIASYGFWLGFFNLAEKTGISRLVQKILNPIVRFLFPNAGEDTRRFVTLNMSANLLGLGNAATPMGIRAAQEMARLAPPGEASNELCRLVVLNTASIQLLPTTVAAIRAAEGAVSPFDILPAVWISSAVSVAVGLAAAYAMERRP